MTAGDRDAPGGGDRERRDPATGPAAGPEQGAGPAAGPGPAAEPDLAPTAPRAQQHWWLHDARWYQEVAKRYGFEAANEINQEALAFVAYRVAQSLARSLPRPVAELSWDEAQEVIKAIPPQMWPPEFVGYVYESPAPGELTTKLVRNFALTMSRRAGTLDTYQCPCPKLRAAWHRGLGLEVAEDRIDGCLKDGADACTYRTSYRGFAAGKDGGTGTGTDDGNGTERAGGTA